MGHELFYNNANVYLIEFNSSIIGFTNVIKDGYRGDRIENIFIKEEFSNKGFGTETLISLFEKHKKLCLISHQENKRAGHLFKKFATPELVGVGELYKFNFEGKTLKNSNKVVDSLLKALYNMFINNKTKTRLSQCTLKQKAKQEN